MNNVATIRLYEEKSDGDPPLAPVIPIKSLKDENKKGKPVSVKTVLRKSVPDFTEPVFKPKKHDMF